MRHEHVSLVAAQAVLAAVFLMAGCGTQAPAAGGDQNLPNAMMGPFRLLRDDELGRKAPFVAKGDLRSPGVLDLDGDPATLPAVLFATTANTPSSIVRYELPDGRTSQAGGQTVLARSASWESPAGVSDAMPLRVGVEVWLYYASGSCIGRAVSSDNGATFTRAPQTPVFCADDAVAPWEQGLATAPSVHVAHDGSFRLLYETNGGIGEARSEDGVTFLRVGNGPVLVPRLPEGPLPADGGVDEPFDNTRVGDPFVLLGQTEQGRLVTYLYFTGTSRLGTRAIGLAARFGDDGVFERAAAPVLTRFEARAPFVVRHGDVTLLYAEAADNEAKPSDKTTIVGGLAPATSTLPYVATGEAR